MTHGKKRIISGSITALHVLAIAGLGYMSALELRKNNMRSGELYADVVKADELGVGVNEALGRLQLHVSSHMNASPLPQLGDNAPVQLSNSYARAKEAEVARVTAEREKVTKDGIAICEEQFGTSRLTTRSECIAAYGAAHPVQPEKTIVADLYRYDFVSPLWTPDKAGWLVLVTALLAFALIIRVVVKIVSPLLLPRD